jgi:hypothetical protein
MFLYLKSTPGLGARVSTVNKPKLWQPWLCSHLSLSWLMIWIVGNKQELCYLLLGACSTEKTISLNFMPWRHHPPINIDRPGGDFLRETNHCNCQMAKGSTGVKCGFSFILPVKLQKKWEAEGKIFLWRKPETYNVLSTPTRTSRNVPVPLPLPFPAPTPASGSLCSVRQPIVSSQRSLPTKESEFLESWLSPEYVCVCIFKQGSKAAREWGRKGKECGWSTH